MQKKTFQRNVMHRRIITRKIMKIMKSNIISFRETKGRGIEQRRKE